MLVFLEFTIPRTDWKAMPLKRRIWLSILGLKHGKKRSMALIGLTPDKLKLLQKMCVTDGKDFAVLKRGSALEIPHIAMRYEGIWDNRGLIQTAQSRFTPKNIDLIMSGIRCFKGKDLKKRDLDSILMSVFEISMFISAVLLLEPLL